jgi:hypothetical protein
MPKLISCLQGADLGYLRIVAELWDLELKAGDARSAIAGLLPLMLDRKKFLDVTRDLPAAGREALDAIYENYGQMSWPAFVRKYGDLREMGAGKREREKPYASSEASGTEMLYYRAILALLSGHTAGPAEFMALAGRMAQPSTRSSAIISACRPHRRIAVSYWQMTASWRTPARCGWIAVRITSAVAKDLAVG